MNTIDDIVKAIMTTELTAEGRHRIYDAIKIKSRAESAMATVHFKIGDKVKMEGGKRDLIGEIVKINRTRVVVKCSVTDKRWSVPASMLTVI